MPNVAANKLNRIATVFLAALCIAFSTGFGAPARADLTIAGGNTRQRLTIEKVYSAHIPARFHTASEIDVQVFDRKAMLSYIREGEQGVQQADQDEDDTIDGIFEDGPPTVTVRATNSTEDLSFTFAHEYGHFVWQDEMTKAEHKRYAAIYYKQRKAHRLVTAYSATDLDEGFAEAFSFYAVAPPVLRERDPLSYNFLCALRP